MAHHVTKTVRKILRGSIPSFAYAPLYVAYQKAFHPERDISYISRVSQFVRKGFFTVHHDGKTFEIMLDPRNGGVDYEIYGRGVYEPHILSIIKKNLSDESFFLDIGANIGQHALFAAACGAHVYAFEPIRRLYYQTLESINKNGLLNVSLFNIGLGSETSQVDIYASEINMGASSIINKSGRKREETIHIKVLDDITSIIGIPRVDFMKIDVEGFEWEVLKGAEQTIRTHRPSILLEYSPDLYALQDPTIGKQLYDFLVSLGYSITDIADGSSTRGIHAFDDLNPHEQTNLLCVPNAVK